MSNLDPRIVKGLRSAYDRRMSRGELLSTDRLQAGYATFRARFGPDALKSLDGPALLHAMHAHGNRKSLVYWLEFKNDDEFPGQRLGSIAGGSAHKFGLFRRRGTEQWVQGPVNNEKNISETDAVAIARRHRDQLMAGISLLEGVGAVADDATYLALQGALGEQAPDICGLAWAHKYWSLLFPEKLDDYHNARWQRHHLVRVLEEPPPQDGLYVCAGRFVRLAADLGWPMNHLTSALNERDGNPIRYWRLGTRLGEELFIWPAMRDGAYAAIGWDALGDLSEVVVADDVREAVRLLLEQEYPGDARTLSRKAGEVRDFIERMQVGDVIVAADGQRVLGVGRATGPYRYEDTEPTSAPHRRTVEWVSTAEWTLPTTEGLQTTFFPIGRTVNDLLEIERRLLDADTTSMPRPSAVPTGAIREDLERFMVMYPERRSRPFGTDQELWSTLNSLQQRFKTLPSVAGRPSIQVTWSVGQGNWARVPWLAFLDSRVTDSTQRGIYVVLLFREDMSGVYMTFNQGVTEPKKLHGAATGLQLIRENAAALRTRCGALEKFEFSLDPAIDLRTEGTLGRDYEAGTIAYKLYDRGAVPADEEIARDLEALLKIYDSEIAEPATAVPAEVEVRPIPPAPPYDMATALDDLFLEQRELEDLLTLWRAKKNLLIQGPPGVGKTFIARRLAFLMMGHRDQARLRMVQFHQAYAYEDFIQGYRPAETGGFVRRDGAFFDFAKLAEADPDRLYVFIIDEINRGNLPKILGELMMLIEFDKRGSEYALPLAYSRPDEPLFSVPANLYLLGLMNTADRSLAMVDYALRRRFAFHTLEPQFRSKKFRSFLEARGAEAALVDMIVDRLTTLNDEIAGDKVRLGPGYQIGHSFFSPADETQTLDKAWYQRVIQYEVAPLLREYWSEGDDQADTWIAALCENLG
jgi:MoxR-like ATPase